MTCRTLALAPWLLIVACGGEDLSDAADASTAPDASAAPDAEPWWGECTASVDYTLGGITCSSSDFSETLSLDAFVAAAGASRMRIDTLPDGNCGLVIRFEGDACIEDQHWAMSSNGAASSPGIVACDPVGCTFGAGDDACAMFDHEATVTLDIAVVLDVGDLDITFRGADGVCAAAGFPIETQHWLVPR